MKKFFNIKIIFSALALLALSACKSPTTDLKIVVDMNIMKYSALVHITDLNGVVVPGATMTITGTAAASVYEISGKKDFTVKDGIITLGLDPAFNIAGGNATFNVAVTAPNYKPTTLPVTFTNGSFQQIVNLSMAPTASSSTGGTFTPPVPVKTATHFIFDFNGYCANKTNLNVRPSLYLFFRETGSGLPFVLLGYMDQGHIETDYLASGKTYDFEITYAGTNYLVTQKIDGTSFNLTFAMGDTICNSF